MAQRPTTSSSRPYTAGGDSLSGWTESDAPSSSHGPASYAYPTAYYGQHQQQHHHQQIEEEEEEEEESEDEDVFAYLPPTTADSNQQQQQQQLQLEQQQQQQQQLLLQQQQQQGGGGIGSLPTTTSTHTPAQMHHLAAAAGLISESPPPDHHQNYPRHHHSPSPDNYDAEAGPDHFIMKPLSSPGGTGTGPETPVRVTLPNTRSGASSGPNSPSLHKRISDQSLTHTQPYSSTRQNTGVTHTKFDDVEMVDEDEDDSPYPEVRASVSNIDDPDMPALTFRVWVLGLLLCILGAGLNTFFNFRYPAPFVQPLLCLLIAHPVGKLAAFALPIRTYKVPFIDYTFSLNPGPFSIKEHVLIYIMTNVSIGPPYAMQITVVSEKFYHLDFGLGFNLTIVLGTALTGFGLAGMTRRFLVWPASMVWPQNLVACTLLNTLHADDDDTSGGITRFRFFIYVLIGSTVWYIVPGFLFTALSYFSFVCWAAPNNLVVNQLFGVYSGLGMSVLTFDWSMISWIGSPLMVPWWAEVHIFAGFVIFYWILAPILYYTNVDHLGNLPIGGHKPYDRFGKPYNISRILSNDPATFGFNVTAYNEYSPLYLATPYFIVYMLAFALSTCLIVHTALYHGRTLLNGFKRLKVEEDDVHARLMRVYPEVPDWWYLACLIVFFALSVVAVEVYHTTVPVWLIALSVLLPMLYVLPSGFIYAMTGQAVGLNLLAEIIPASLVPGNPIANMVFKAYSVQTMGSSLSFIQDLKFGHYIKVPPRATFMAQLVATILASFVQVGVKFWLYANVPDICSDNQKDGLTCPHNSVFFTASAVWGLVGPTRQFGPGSEYNAHVYAMIAGALLPIPFWYYQRRYPTTRLKYINIPVFVNGPTFIPPASGLNYSAWFVVAFIFQYVIRRRNFRWWSKFNYLLSAALDSGTILSIIIIFLALSLPNGGVTLDWWGNTVWQKTLDFQPKAIYPPPKEGF